MKKFFKYAVCLMAGALMTTGMTSCDDNDDEIIAGELSPKEQAIKKFMIPYVDHTIIQTYHEMAEYAIKLSEKCEEIKAAHKDGSLKIEQIEEAGQLWKSSRKYWEQSEAFLFGAAGDYNIDPHIDSWPLDKNAMMDLLEDLRNGKEWTIDNNGGYGLIGFHALEYMLFELSEDGEKSLPHNTNYKPEELIYTCTVAEDLRNQCVRLEAAWAGMENVSSAKQAMLTDAELEPTINYGESMKNAGQGGSLYKNYKDAAEALVQGAMDICDEVAALKIGKPNTGSNEDDKNYIESPYSLNSVVDFADNIVSIQHAYQGSVEGDASMSDYIRTLNSNLDKKIIDQIQISIQAIRAIKEPFAKHATEAEATKAIEELNVLNELLGQLPAELEK